MLLDALVQFVNPFGPALSLVGGPGVSFNSPIVDLLGLGVGVAPTNIIGTRSTFGADLGLGMKKAQLETVVGTAAVTANSATLNIAVQGAPDSGAAGGYLPGTWQTLVETGALTAAQLTAGAVAARFDWPAAFPPGTLPRFMRVQFGVLAAANFTALSIAYSIVTMGRDDWSAKYAAKNFAVA